MMILVIFLIFTFPVPGRIPHHRDVADEFLEEILRDIPSSTEEHNRQYPEFELKYTTEPAKVTNQALSAAGKIQH
ncbi:hypothetical protein HAX54_020573 [Datura stramonium]|uniref:Secreted protein n=1 Tax=Datura stramonium TaxID=4076 RepID=A0ABS8S2K6_DATST|nr:hypothetical protein [Datura stramonium]